jgi:hypothetical protein
MHGTNIKLHCNHSQLHLCLINNENTHTALNTACSTLKPLFHYHLLNFSPIACETTPHHDDVVSSNIFFMHRSFFKLSRYHDWLRNQEGITHHISYKTEENCYQNFPSCCVRFREKTTELLKSTLRKWLQGMLSRLKGWYGGVRRLWWKLLWRDEWIDLAYPVF